MSQYTHVVEVAFPFSLCQWCLRRDFDDVFGEANLQSSPAPPWFPLRRLCCFLRRLIVDHRNRGDAIASGENGPHFDLYHSSCNCCINGKDSRSASCGKPFLLWLLLFIRFVMLRRGRDVLTGSEERLPVCRGRVCFPTSAKHHYHSACPQHATAKAGPTEVEFWGRRF